MEADLKTALPDIQSTEDERNIFINRVGVRGVKLPIVVSQQNGTQHTIADLTMTVSLDARRKGTHMSRFISVMENLHEPLSPEVMRRLLSEMVRELQATSGTIDVRFPYFVRKTAPITLLESVMNYECGWTADIENNAVTVRQHTLVPVTSLCPCSREISRYGAHNQRSHLSSTVLCSTPLSLEEQIVLSENAASCPLWSRLKRADEKYVTEYAYEHPKFVEDIVRDLATSFNADERVLAYRVEAENFESIHNHSAYAWIERDKRA